jgi:PAS domain S-box-containing protein
MPQNPKDQIIKEREQIGALESELKQAEQVALAANAKLHETRQHLTRLIETSPDAVISTDKEGNVVLFSESAEALLGYRAKEVTGRSTSILYGDEAGARQVAREMRKRGGTVSSFESGVVAKDGGNIPVLISASVPLDEKGEEDRDSWFCQRLARAQAGGGEARGTRYGTESCPRPISVATDGHAWGHLHHSGLRRLRVHVRQRERRRHYGIFAVGDG